MRWGRIRAIVRKDLLAVRRTRGVMLPLIGTPILVLVVLPTVLVGGAELIGDVAVPGQADGSLAQLGQQAEVTTLAGTDAGPEARWTVFVLEVLLAPLFLTVPLIGAIVVATNAFTGERDRGTLEGLLHTPITERELVAGKFLAAWLPAALVAWIGFGIYAVLANVLAWGVLGRIFFPSPMWLLLGFAIAPGIAALGLALMVVASSRVRSTEAAHQIGALLILPLMVALVMQVVGAMLLAPRLVAVIGTAIWVLAGASLLIGSAGLRRSDLALPP